MPINVYLHHVKRVLRSFGSFVGIGFVCLLFVGSFSLFCVGVSDDYCFSNCSFDMFASWLALPVAVLGLVLSRIFLKKRVKRFFSWYFFIMVGVWFFHWFYLGPSEIFRRTAWLCKPERFIEADGGERRLGIYVLDAGLPPIAYLVRDERKFLPIIWRTRVLFRGCAGSADVKKIGNSRYEVKLFDYHEIGPKGPKLVGRIVWP